MHVAATIVRTLSYGMCAVRVHGVIALPNDQHYILFPVGCELTGRPQFIGKWSMVVKGDWVQETSELTAYHDGRVCQGPPNDGRIEGPC